MAVASEIDGEDDCRDRKADEGTDPDSDRQTQPLTSPFGPTGYCSSGRSTRRNESDCCPHSSTRRNDCEPFCASRCQGKSEYRKCRAGHHCQHESDQTACRRLGTPQSDDARCTRCSHRDETCKRAVGANETMVVFDSFGNGFVSDRGRLTARPRRSLHGWSFGVRRTRGLRSRSGGNRDRSSHTRSARSGHRSQDSATPIVEVRHAGLRSDLT